VAAVTTASAQTPPDNEIWYTTTDGKKAELDEGPFPGFYYYDNISHEYNIISHTYNNGKGVIRADQPITIFGAWGTFRGYQGIFFCSENLKSVTFPPCLKTLCQITSSDWGTYDSLTSITIPNSVTSIGEAAFSGCSSLTSITIPNSVISIGGGAFEGCSSLKLFKGKYASKDGRCLIKDGELMAFAPAGLTSYTIPDSVTSIESSAFSGCSNLSSITIPENVTSIGNYAFRGCSNLSSITIPENVTSFGTWAFFGCCSLKSITIPNSVTSIGDWAFRGCSSLTSITIPNSVTSIGDEAFKGCSSLPVIDNIRYADTYLVEAVDKSLTTYSIKPGTRFIGSYAFYDCSSLKSITIPESVTSIGERAFRGCSSLTSITIPESVTSIGEGAFHDCSSLTNITIPESVTSIGGSAFYGCNSLTSITIPNSVKSIGEHTFNGCSSLTSITIPNSITSIEESAFYDCSSLKSVKISNKYCYDYFKDLGGCDITFMISTLEEYEEAQKLGATKIAIDSNSKYASEDGLCLIDNGELILFIGKNLTEYTIPEGVTSFRKEVFKGCSGLKSVKVSNKHCYDYFKDKVTNIAFYGANASADGRCLISNGKLERFIATGLTTYDLPKSVTEIAAEALTECSKLQSATVANAQCYNTLKEAGIAISAFTGANASADGRCMIIDSELCIFIGDNVTEYVIPQNVTKISNGVFRNCDSLRSITIPSDVTAIGDQQFSGLDTLASITCMAMTPPAISDLNIVETTLIYVPKEAVKLYKKDPNWIQYKKQIKAIK
jgi:hypothetical protein